MSKRYRKEEEKSKTSSSPIHEAWISAALISPDYRPTIFSAMGTFGPALFASQTARYVYNAYAADATCSPMDLLERPDAPQDLERFLLQALDILHSWESTNKDKRSLTQIVDYLAGLARKRLILEAVEKEFTPVQLSEVIANLPTTAPAEEVSFTDLLTSRYRELVDSIGLKQDNVLQTTWSSLNRIMQGGFRDGELIVIAARPGMGKTALALCIALSLSFQRGVDFYSMEMGSKEILDRCLSILLDIPNSEILQPTDRLRKYQRAVEQFTSIMDLRLEDRGSLTLNEMLYRSKGRVPVIDYLQLVPGLDRGDDYESRQLQVTAMSKACKEYARVNQTPVIVLSQLNREVEKRKDKRPLPSDLRESGAVEQDADKILFIYRDAVYNGEDEDKQRPHEAELIVSKQRNGPTGTVRLTFEPMYGRFYEGE